MANLSALSAIAGALRGGLQGYNNAQTRSRQEALDALQAKRQEEDMDLRRVAESRLAEANRLAAENARLAREGKERDRQTRDFNAPIQSAENKYGPSQGTEDARALLPKFLGAEDYERFPVEDGEGDSEQVNTDDGPVVADTSSFVQSKGDVLKARAAALVSADRGPAKPEKTPTKTAAQIHEEGMQVRHNQKQMDDITKAMKPYAPQVEAIDAIDKGFEKGAFDDNFLDSFLMKNSLSRLALTDGTAESRRQVMDLFVEQLKATSGGAVTDSEALRSELATFFAAGVPVNQFKTAWESWKRKRMLNVNAALAGKDPKYVEKWRKGLQEKRNPFATPTAPSGPAASLAGPQITADQKKQILGALQPGERAFIVNGRAVAIGPNEQPPAGAVEVK